jgi:hypothetical protein
MTNNDPIWFLRVNFINSTNHVEIPKNPKLFAGSESEFKINFGFGYGFGSRHYNLIVEHDKY